MKNRNEDIAFVIEADADKTNLGCDRPNREADRKINMHNIDKNVNSIGTKRIHKNYERTEK